MAAEKSIQQTKGIVLYLVGYLVNATLEHKY